jgi:hypothetical protein
MRPIVDGAQGPGKVAVCTNARACLSLNLAPCLDQRGCVAPGTTWGHWKIGTNRDLAGALFVAWSPYCQSDDRP